MNGHIIVSDFDNLYSPFFFWLLPRRKRLQEEMVDFTLKLREYKPGVNVLKGWLCDKVF